jgi:hypothetical protein
MSGGFDKRDRRHELARPLDALAGLLDSFDPSFPIVTP